jgi:hypothetical protein
LLLRRVGAHVCFPTHQENWGYVLARMVCFCRRRAASKGSCAPPLPLPPATAAFVSPLALPARSPRSTFPLRFHGLSWCLRISRRLLPHQQAHHVSRDCTAGVGGQLCWVASLERASSCFVGVVLRVRGGAGRGRPEALTFTVPSGLQALTSTAPSGLQCLCVADQVNPRWQAARGLRRRPRAGAPVVSVAIHWVRCGC